MRTVFARAWGMLGIKGMHSKWIKCISTQGNVRGVALQATELLQDLGVGRTLGDNTLVSAVNRQT